MFPQIFEPSFGETRTPRDRVGSIGLSVVRSLVDMCTAERSASRARAGSRQLGLLGQPAALDRAAASPAVKFRSMPTCESRLSWTTTRMPWLMLLRSAGHTVVTALIDRRR